MSGRWNPWQALAETPSVHLRFTRLVDPLIGLCDVDADGGPTITLANNLTRAERNAVLAHELVHLERGGGIDHDGAPPSWRDVVAREEAIVDREVARRLVPTGELRRFLHQRAALGEAVTVDDVMREFDVPDWVALDALALARPT
jgi:hypothetical protein